ncbi:5-(carboxyamino)imidazole ribonucleotide synthase [Vaginisenegalia massiliensis]|uniref:5-(carboxyamino)imidazole ribonucleotide synthase n=1 Tax=Vaginisenegalia massiliensis TaxID=2058294 RepID=UPI001F14A271|nr:5-(carboxyamino)imidazole ribonucleotide synthase [Vaginisenegalia massiliensis]
MINLAYKQLLPGASIGIIGAGQLGKMLAQSAQKMGYRVVTFDPNPQACAFSVSHDHVCASFDDRQALLDFAGQVDVVTYEFENINGPLLAELADKAYLPQGTQLLLTAQHRIKEKEWLASIGAPVVDFRLVSDFTQLEEAVASLGLPAILKTTRLGYDGKGQMKLQSQTDLLEKRAELDELLQAECILEAFSPFDYEVSVMVARDVYGNCECFPVSQNQHEAGVLACGLAPAPIAGEMAQKAQEVAKMIAQASQLIGVLGIEFFVEGDRIVVNELAPRPHNTGHYTMEACNVSQYDQHILAITGRPLVPVKLLSPSLMVNIMGQHMPQLATTMDQFPQAVFHLYNKGQAKFQRKMGHFTILADQVEKLQNLRDESPFLKDWSQKYYSK